MQQQSLVLKNNREQLNYQLLINSDHWVGASRAKCCREKKSNVPSAPTKPRRPVDRAKVFPLEDSSLLHHHHHHRSSQPPAITAHDRKHPPALLAVALCRGLLATTSLRRH
jgi:hypothetical protein